MYPFFAELQKPLISLIVPVYQSEPYIDTCIQSVLGQTYSNFELILVDDGSKDGSRAICESWGAGDSRIRVLVQEHQGVSAARNTGMRAAKGEYLFFLDSDDAIHPDLLEQLCRFAEESQAAISACPYRNILSENFEKTKKQLDRRPCRNRVKRTFHQKGRAALRSFTFSAGLVLWSTIGGKMIRRSEAEGIWFDEELSHREDTKYLYELLESGADVAVLPNPGYYYRKRNNSASQQQSIEAYKSSYTCACNIRDREIEHGRIENAIQWESNIVSSISWWYTRCRAREDESLKSYVLELEKAERSSALWKELGIRVRLKHMLAFHCYPLYAICRALWRMLLRIAGV